MNPVSSEIFRMYDIRGVYRKELTDETAYLIGKALGTFFQNNGQSKVAVGRDNRVSGPAVCANFIKGLVETGCEVTDFGLVLNPLIYFSWYHLDFNAAAVVTASHNPAQYNGFKISMNKSPLMGDDYQEIYRICQSGQFSRGEGKLLSGNIWPDYKNNILKTISLKRKLKVAVDCGNGTASLFAPEILRDLGCEVTEFYCESDGSFPNHTPYPQKVEYYAKMIEAIRAGNLDLGLAFDGDGDRLGVYDNQGVFVEGDRLAMIFSQDICQKNQGAKIVMNVSTSLAVSDYIKASGGEFFLSQTGYPYVSAKMKDVGALLGAEISGHFFFKDKYLGFDDALYAGIRILEILSKSDETLSLIVSKLPRYHETREFRVAIPPEVNKDSLIEKVEEEIKNEYPEAEILGFDGIRFSFPDGWGLIRPSNTEPLLTGRAEAKTQDGLDKIKELIKDKLGKYGIILDWDKI